MHELRATKSSRHFCYLMKTFDFRSFNCQTLMDRASTPCQLSGLLTWHGQNQSQLADVNPALEL